jgi:two-component system chemotaxis response regulator CheB
MGRNGAEELRLMKEKVAVTLVHDKDSSAVYGMPWEAIKLDAEMLVLQPEKAATALANLADHRGNNGA